MMKERKIKIGVVFGIVTGVITLLALIVVFFFFFFLGGPPKKIRGARYYEETIEKYTTMKRGNVRTGFVCFPDEIPQSAFADGKEPTFYFYYQDTWDDPTSEVYLYCEYDEEDYQAELDRLAKEERVYESGALTLLEDSQGRFPYPVYLAIDHEDFSYEYAILPGNNTIAYIFTAFKNTKDKLDVIPKEYLPYDFEETLTLERGVRFNDEGYNIYTDPLSPSTSYYHRD